MPTPNAPLDEWLTYISTQHHKEIALGLTRSREVAQRLGVLPLAPRTLIVAGTNGKGSTVRFAESLLLAQGVSVGATLSPHLHRYNERVRLQGQEATDQQLVAAFEAVEKARGDIPLTYYEYSVLGAFWLFRQAKLDCVVVEVGLGGRLDTTNIIDADVAAITSIGLDHQAFLGDTLELIGAEKVEVCRRGAPLLLGGEMPDSVTQVARRKGALMARYGDNFWYVREADSFGVRLDGGERSLISPRLPRIAGRNAALAAACVGALTRPPTSAELFQAAQTCDHPGRFERLSYRRRSVLLDVAHNPASAHFLAQQLDQHWPDGRFVACCGFLADKDVAGIVAALGNRITHWVLLPTPGDRGLSADEAAERTRQGLTDAFGAQHLQGLTISTATSVAQGMAEAHALAAKTDIIVAFGSFAHAQHVRELLMSRPNA